MNRLALALRPKLFKKPVADSPVTEKENVRLKLEHSVEKIETKVQSGRGKSLRLRYWLGTGFQVKYAMLTTAFGVLISALLGIFLFTTFWQTAMEDLTWQFGSRLPVEIYHKVRATFFVSAVGAGLLITGIAVLCSVWITHRASGPMFNMKRVLGSWLSGSLKSRIRLRKSDEEEMQDFANGLNELADQFAQEKAWRERLVKEVVKDLADRKDAWADQVARKLEVVLSDEVPEAV
ncbi:MAG: hypothetical protein QGF00_21885 [Planctomycetota bacterium]|jgi:methyl-accepting chemotaxis protein|nr:hypothetical protein [Planctomycetota bacterium]MDP7252276.1 hypothetical protein [Planctomycetota bacterium]